jgi:hypothetical protein
MISIEIMLNILLYVSNFKDYLSIIASFCINKNSIEEFDTLLEYTKKYNKNIYCLELFHNIGVLLSNIVKIDSEGSPFTFKKNIMYVSDWYGDPELYISEFEVNNIYKVIVKYIYEELSRFKNIENKNTYTKLEIRYKFLYKIMVSKTFNISIEKINKLIDINSEADFINEFCNLETKNVFTTNYSSYFQLLNQAISSRLNNLLYTYELIKEFKIKHLHINYINHSEYFGYDTDIDNNYNYDDFNETYDYQDNYKINLTNAYESRKMKSKSNSKTKNENKINKFKYTIMNEISYKLNCPKKGNIKNKNRARRFSSKSTKYNSKHNLMHREVYA